ncbi:Anaphase-promoting complex subunit 11 [Plasmodiophora brassicae]|uniref:Anaphase-promoting complex subunit 11 n=1 Tax=Plasmodiophora brassicae TaxID=37360 RepID=A0A0G4IMP5_PLABS|nr:hypothetical protein PBRA_005090 [Plasmodiophora brassicae]SPQ99358.1 unnamed protein product [Plasmodiophora brassicae]
MKIDVLNWRAVAVWRWKVDEESCGICCQPFDGCCPACVSPGDDCPPVWGECNHTFHIHCILKWLKEQSSRQQCPLCRRDWQYKGEGEQPE